MSPRFKQKFSTRLTRPGVNARVSGPGCYAPPRLGSPACLITELRCTVSLKGCEERRLLLYRHITVSLTVHSSLKTAYQPIKLSEFEPAFQNSAFRQLVFELRLLFRKLIFCNQLFDSRRWQWISSTHLDFPLSSMCFNYYYRCF